MSLMVWLPLNGSLDNIGTSSYTFTNNGAIVDNEGKIGKCYSFSGSNTIHNLNISIGASPISMCCWIYCSDNITDTLYFGSLNTSGGFSDHCIGLAALNSSFYFVAGGNSTLLSSATLNTWKHLAVTYDGATITGYVDGIKIGTTACTTPLTRAKLTLGARANTTTANTFTYYFKGKMNDFRLYNHCLSAAEVHEISLGLVLHYKLNDIPNPNLLLNTNSPAQHTANISTTNNYSVKDIYTMLAPVNQLFTEGEIVTFSFDWSYTGSSNTGNFHTEVGNVTPWNIGTVLSASGTRSATSNYIDITNTNTSGHVRVTYAVSNAAATAADSFKYFRIRKDNTPDGSVLTFSHCKLERGSIETRWIPNSADTAYNIFYSATIFDSSGYNNNGTLSSNPPTTISSQGRYSTAMLFNGTDNYICAGRGGMVRDAITVNIWGYKNPWDTAGRIVSCTEGGGWNFESGSSYVQFAMGTGESSNTYKQIKSSVLWTSLSAGWHMFTGTYDGFSTKVYVDGVLKGTNSAYTTKTPAYYHSSNGVFLGAEAAGTATTPGGTYWAGGIGDFRVYCTALSADDIKALYEVGAKVDNKGCFHSYELIENLSNIMFKVDSARAGLIFQDGLNKWSLQANCQVTLTSLGYRIYRPPNITYDANDSSTKTMWGGLKICNLSTDSIHVYDATIDNILGLQKNHTYLWAYHLKGKSSVGINPTILSNMGWDRIAGVGPNPTLIARLGISDNFEGEKDCYYIFTIADDIVKTANLDKSTYVNGSQYLSYRHFCFGWDYGNTGTLGTDVYLTNFRLYDITNYMSKINKLGQANFGNLVELLDKCAIRQKSELLATQFIEI